MKVLIVALGSAGDVHPFLGIGRTLRARGHAVAVCANPVFRPLIERCGLGFRAVGSEAAYHAAMDDPALWDPRRSLRRLWSAIAADLQPLFELLAAEVDGDTVLLGSLWAFGARLAQEKLGVPYLSVQVSPSTLLSAHAPPVHPRFTLPRGLPLAARAGLIRLIEHAILDRTFGPDLNRLRRRLGLAPVRRILGRWLHSPQGVVGLFPPWFAAPQPDWPQPLTQAGFPLFDAAEFEPLDDELLDFLHHGPAPVIVTPGSTSLHGPPFFAAAAEALRRCGRRGVLLGGDALALPGLPRTLRARRYVPLSRLLPHAAALLHHGGIGTSALALAAGVPQLAAPVAHDQFDNAARLQRLGVALPVQELAASLDRLLASEAVHTACAGCRGRTDSGETTRRRVALALEALHPPAAASINPPPIATHHVAA